MPLCAGSCSRPPAHSCLLPRRDLGGFHYACAPLPPGGEGGDSRQPRAASPWGAGAALQPPSRSSSGGHWLDATSAGGAPQRWGCGHGVRRSCLTATQILPVLASHGFLEEAGLSQPRARGRWVGGRRRATRGLSGGHPIAGGWKWARPHGRSPGSRALCCLSYCVFIELREEGLSCFIARQPGLALVYASPPPLHGRSPSAEPGPFLHPCIPWWGQCSGQRRAGPLPLPQAQVPLGYSAQVTRERRRATRLSKGLERSTSGGEGASLQPPGGWGIGDGR